MFRKDMEPHCAYCRKGYELSDGEVFCPRRGVVSGGDACRGFQYDPLRRVPPKPLRPDFSRLREEDFVL